MSRSYRHTPVIGMACLKGQRWYKKWRAGRERMRVREMLAHQDYDIAFCLVPWNEWATTRDGHQWLGLRREPELERYMRK